MGQASMDRFQCKCGCGENMVDPRVVARVEAIEDDLQHKLVIASGYRCEQHNRWVGGSPTSSHLKGLACDIECDGSRDRWQLVGAAIRAGIDRIGIRREYVHLDIDRAKDARVIWVY